MDVFHKLPNQLFKITIIQDTVGTQLSEPIGTRENRTTKMF